MGGIAWDTEIKFEDERALGNVKRNEGYGYWAWAFGRLIRYIDTAGKAVERVILESR